MVSAPIIKNQSSFLIKKLVILIIKFILKIENQQTISLLATDSAFCLAVSLTYSVGDLNFDFSKFSGKFEGTTVIFKPFKKTFK